ncbi:hypothetical protein HPB48_019777 [Haemaphysalis longicornis]|uniref:Uncharacterized protein n=1 Tax=Haemaphysalis longicornis TaxID=44386 RepID=A0A9J6FS55_HAELO|nr:hypothetical protein HPB48_019777 [Haemaphysalis longicornis]
MFPTALRKTKALISVCFVSTAGRPRSCEAVAGFHGFGELEIPHQDLKKGSHGNLKLNGNKLPRVQQAFSKSIVHTLTLQRIFSCACAACFIFTFVSIYCNSHIARKRMQPTSKLTNSVEEIDSQSQLRKLPGWKSLTACRNSSLRLLYFVHTAPKNTGLRKWLRHTIGNPEVASTTDSAIVFIVGELADHNGH